MLELETSGCCLVLEDVGEEIESAIASTTFVAKPESENAAVGVDFQLHRMVKQLSRSLKRKNSKLDDLVRKKKSMTKKLNDQETQLLKLTQRLDEAEKNSAESSLKLAVMKQELDKCKTAMQVWHTNSPSGKMPENYQCQETSLPEETKDLKRAVPPH